MRATSSNEDVVTGKMANIFQVQHNERDYCKCKSFIPEIDNDSFEYHDVEISKEKLRGIEYGVPFEYSGFYFLPDDFLVKPSTKDLQGCPKGYKALDVKLYEKIHDSAQDKTYELFTNPKKFNLNLSRNYMLNTKSYPESFSKRKGKSWMFKKIELDSEAKLVRYIDESSFSDKKMYTKCYLSEDDYELSMLLNLNKLGTLYTNREYQFMLSNTNIRAVLWKSDLDNKIQKGMDPKFKFTEAKCYHIYIYAVLLNNKIAKTCWSVNVIEVWGTNKKTSLKLAKKNKKMFKSNAYDSHHINNVPKNCPLVMDRNDNTIISYTDQTSVLIKILVINKNLEKVKEFDFGLKGHPISITRTNDNNFALLGYFNIKRVELFIIHFNLNGDILWKKNIISNINKYPSKRGKNDLIFYKKSKKSKTSVPEFGMDAMFFPRQGRILYINGYIGVIFTRYNKFVSGKISQADIFVSYTREGKHARAGSIWGMSPSYDQSLISDGLSFISASLGGKPNGNIRICFTTPTLLESEEDPVLRYKTHMKHSCKKILKTKIDVDYKNRICGKLGGIFSNDGKYALAYVKRPCLVKNSNNKNVPSNQNQFGLLLFDDKFNIKQDLKLGPGKRIVCINSSMFGKYILLVFTIKRVRFNIDVFYDSVDPVQDRSYATLLDFNGRSVSKKPIRLPYATCDEIASSKNGGFVISEIINSNINVVKFDP